MPKLSESSTGFFVSQARPGGILSTPGKITDETAKRLKEAFEAGYTGQNAGRIAVVGDGLKFDALTMAANDAQLVEQLRWMAETIAMAYGIPLAKLGLAPQSGSETAQQGNTRARSTARMEV